MELFYSNDIEGGICRLDHDESGHCIKVLRHRCGDEISVIDGQKNFMGGMIIPGLQVSLDSLANRTSQLPHISLEAPKKVIGTNTVDCMKSGIIYSTAGSIDGAIERIEEELGASAQYPGMKAFSHL